MLRINDRLSKQDSAARLLLQVHDELILELPEDEKAEVSRIIKEEMEGAANLAVPLKVDLASGKPGTTSGKIVSLTGSVK